LISFDMSWTVDWQFLKSLYKIGDQNVLRQVYHR